MVEESLGQPIDATTTPSTAGIGGHEESGARGMLREALLKVMEEIEHHEREAKQHLQKATELRKALRESVAFLHEQGEKKSPVVVPRGSRAEKAGEPSLDDKAKQGVTS